MVGRVDLKLHEVAPSRSYALTRSTSDRVSLRAMHLSHERVGSYPQTRHESHDPLDPISGYLYNRVNNLYNLVNRDIINFYGSMYAQSSST
jgi:hypothetical protein